MPNIPTNTNRKRAMALAVFLAFIALAGFASWYVHASSKASEESTASEESNGVSVLLGLADTAFHDQRLVAPEGSNMYEFYLSVLQLTPHNKQALDRLHTAFEPACHDVEETIAKGDLDEAERELRLLHDYGAQESVESNNYKVGLLGSYLHAQRNVLTRKHEAEAMQIQEGQTASGAN